MVDPNNTPAGSERNGEGSALLLLANGTSGAWDIAVDEMAGKPGKLFAHIEGPSAYLYFSLLSVKTIGEAIHFLGQRRQAPASRAREDAAGKENTLRLGVFGRAPVNLVWDDEYVDRCFLVVGVSSKPSIRLTLSGQEIDYIIAALQQVQEDLGDPASSPS